jgi:cytoskeletal protein CcmA (bactofilin family)
MSYIRLGAIVLLLSGGAVQAAVEKYQLELRPAARTDATRLLAVGDGTADVMVDGNKLTINGKFGGMASAATDAHLCIGEGIGTRGTCDAGELTVTKDKSGTVSGTLTLNAKQLAALPAGRLYVQINSVGSPAPAGNLWGWILIAHETVGQDVPQEGHWFLPQYDMPKSVEHGSTHPLPTDANS